MANLDDIDNTRDDDAPRISRLNKVPVFLAIGIGVIFFAVVVYGLSTRGIGQRDQDIADEGGRPASDFADQLKSGVSDGVIEPPAPPAPVQQAQPVVQPPQEQQKAYTNPFQDTPQQKVDRPVQLEPEVDWRAKMEREFEQQELEERHRQRMKRIQSVDAALDSPLNVELDRGNGQAGQQTVGNGIQAAQGFGGNRSAADLYSAAMQAANGQGTGDLNMQSNKEEFFGKDIADAGYLPNRVLPQQSPFELKRGSVIPATLITGINSDLPGRITAQVRQNVYDSATGHRLLIPQGTKLFGRYDSKVSFGQSRVLVVWTDVIFPNGATLQIGSMAGVDGEGYGGFKDKVNNHYFKTFGSAVLLALIGTGIDVAIPNDSTLTNQTTAADSARQNFAEVFGRVAEKTIEKNLDVQPTIEIRPGYNFNILVDQDIIFPGIYQG